MILQLVRLWLFQLLSLLLQDISHWTRWLKINGFVHFTLSEIQTFKSITSSQFHIRIFSHTFRTFVRIDNICAYSIMIVISALSIYAIGLGKLFVLELYLRGGFQLIACSKDLRNEIDNTDFVISELLFMQKAFWFLSIYCKICLLNVLLIKNKFQISKCCWL